MSAQPEKRTFNVDEYYRMARAGVLKPDDRVELIEGEIVKMSPIGSPHAACVSRLNSLLQSMLGRTAIISVQNPVRLNDFSEPVPDVTVLKRRKDFYSSHHPRPSEVRLIIEVAETTLLYDRRIKVPLYARNSIPEVWLVNLPKKLIEEYFEVAGGRNRQLQKCKRDEKIESAALPGLSFNVSEIFG
jgi:Uma2 family endonuclease